MNLYSNKQRWKVILLVAATIIVAITLWYSNNIASKIRKEEQLKVQLWSEAIQQRAELVNYTQELFEELGSEERQKADMLVQAYNLINDPPDGMDLTFITDFLWSNKTIPVLIYDENDSLLYHVNLPFERAKSDAYVDSLKSSMSENNPPILFEEVGHKVYYNESFRFQELKAVMQNLINSFISETVINSASVPVVLTDSTRRNVVRSERVDDEIINDLSALRSKLSSMEEENPAIEIDLPGSGKHFIFFEDSLVLKQLKYFPVVQLILIGVFLMVAYLIFSTFRKAEQNQVWVGMAKETAHQLGTPLSSLMAWVSMLEDQGVDKSVITELDKDVKRLNMITDRFSKIGSKPDLKDENIAEVLDSAIDYLQPRISTKVEVIRDYENTGKKAKLSRPLFGWVLENLIKNAVDAMSGAGTLTAEIGESQGMVYVDISDTGKGISRTKIKTVFEPGYTTKKRGWGLGLSLTKRIIEQYHEGKIFVKKSEVGQGTTFRILLCSSMQTEE